MKRLLLSVGLAVGPTLAVTQQPTTANLSLADALALARSHNPFYRQALPDRAPAGWAARNAWSSTFLPTLTASGGLGYSGSGQQRFLTANFSQNVSTLSSNYGLFLDWALNGQTLTQIPLKHAQLSAADADVAGAQSKPIPRVAPPNFSVPPARPNADAARQGVDLDQPSLKGARGRGPLGRPGGHGRVHAERLGVGQLVGVHAKTLRHQSDDCGSASQRRRQHGGVPVREHRLVEYRAIAAPLQRARVHTPAGAGDPRPERGVPVQLYAAAVPGAPLDQHSAVEQLLPAAPGLAGEGATAGPGGIGAGARAAGTHRREPGVPHRHDRLPHHRDPRHEPHGGARAAAARHRALSRRLGHVFRAAGRAGGAAAGGERLCERRLRISQGGRRARGGGGPAPAGTRGRHRHVQA